jgi:pimeloyl-ACP methyl ester carboxylesterase
MTESFTKKQTVIKDLLLSYYTKGGGERSILFLHGWGSQSTLWFPSIQSTDFANTSLYFLKLPTPLMITLP